MLRVHDDFVVARVSYLHYCTYNKKDGCFTDYFRIVRKKDLNRYKRQHSNKGNCFCKKSLQIIIHFVFLQIKNYFLCNLWKHSSRIGEWNLELLYIEAKKGHKKRPLYSDPNYKSYVIHGVLHITF